jgi:Transposase DDE domain/Transposase domain (DUF772)
VQGVARWDRELWDAEAVAGDLVPAGSVFAFLAAHRRVLFDDSFTADLFPSGTGRPSLPADLVGSVLVLKELYGLSDRQTAEAVMFDLRWKVACGRSLTAGSFDPTTLVYWRRRIAASDRPDRVFDKLAEVIAETGVLRGRRRRCVDSTVFDDAVATQDTVTLLVAAIRKVARTVPGAAAVVAEVCRGDYSRAGKPDIDWDDPQAKTELVSMLVNDALAVLARLCGPDAPEREDAAADALGLLALVAGQDVEPAEGSDGTDGRWRIARRVAPDRVISTVDPQARHTRKSRSQRRDGYRAHLMTEPDTGLITDCEMTMATGPDNTDAAMGITLADRDRFHPDTHEPTEPTEPTEPVDQAEPVVDPTEPAEPAEPTDPTEPAEQADQAAPAEPAEPVDATEASGSTTHTGQDSSGQHPDDDQRPGTGQRPGDDQDPGAGLEIYGDSAYGSGQARADYAAAGHDTMIKPKPVSPAVPGGFTMDDFTIDDHAKTVTCPGGHTRPMSANRTVTFGKLCADCPLRARCTTAQAGRSMTIHEHEHLLRAARAQARTPQFQAAYPTRASVERTVAHVATQNGRRVKLRYRGVATNNAWLHTRAAALNLRTLIRRGLTHSAGTWRLASA